MTVENRMDARVMGNARGMSAPTAAQVEAKRAERLAATERTRAGQAGRQSDEHEANRARFGAAGNTRERVSV